MVMDMDNYQSYHIFELETKCFELPEKEFIMSNLKKRIRIRVCAERLNSH